MIDIIALVGLILGIIIIISKKAKQHFKYIGLALIVLCLIYIVPEFLNGFIKEIVRISALP